MFLMWCTYPKHTAFGTRRWQRPRTKGPKCCLNSVSGRPGFEGPPKAEKWKKHRLEGSQMGEILAVDGPGCRWLRSFVKKKCKYTCANVTKSQQLYMSTWSTAHGCPWFKCSIPFFPLVSMRLFIARNAGTIFRLFAWPRHWKKVFSVLNSIGKTLKILIFKCPQTDSFLCDSLASRLHHVLERNAPT